MKKSLVYRTMEKAVSLFGHKRIYSLDTPHLNEYIEKTAPKRRSAPPKFLYSRVRIETKTIANRSCYVLSPKGTPAKNGPAVLFLHGGGMFLEANLLHWNAAAKLAEYYGATVWFPVYPLLPDSDMHRATKAVLAAYREMLQQHPASTIRVWGDSIGAALAIMMCFSGLEQDSSFVMPAKLVLLSPGMVSVADESLVKDIQTLELSDPIFCTSFLYSMSEIMNLTCDSNDYFSWPFAGDFSRFPPIEVFSGTHEIFFAQMQKFIEQAKKTGASIRLHVGDGMMHDWPLMPLSRECRDALSTVFDLLTQS